MILARLSFGLSQAELAKLVGVSERTIRNYESGEIKKPYHLQKIAKERGRCVKRGFGKRQEGKVHNKL